MPLMYGKQGDKLGAKQQAVLDRLMTEGVAQQTIFDKYATMTKGIPQKSGRTITFRKAIKVKDLMLANKIYKEYTGNDVTGRGEGVATLVDRDYYKEFILTEGESGSERSYGKYVEYSTDIFPIGFWSKITEEVSLLHDMWTLNGYIQELTEVGSYIIDGFYRDLYINSAGHQIDISGNDDGHNSFKDADFTNANKKIGMQLRLSGAKYVHSILSNSANYATIPLKTKYVAIVNPLAEFSLRENPDFIPVEKYPNTGAVMENEIGSIGEIRYITNENMLIEEIDATSAYAYALIMGADHTANIPLRGKNRIETIVKGLDSKDKSDPLNRFQIVGFKSWLGAYTINPERLALIKGKIQY